MERILRLFSGLMKKGDVLGMEGGWVAAFVSYICILASKLGVCSSLFNGNPGLQRDR